MRLRLVRKIIHRSFSIPFQSAAEQKSRKIYQTVSIPLIHTLIIHPVTQSYRLLLIHSRNRLVCPFPRHFAPVTLVQRVELERDREITEEATGARVHHDVCMHALLIYRCSALRVHACRTCTAGCEEAAVNS